MNQPTIPSRIARITSLLAILAQFPWSPVSATNVGTGLISQLTYLGTASQPDRIPLSPAIYNANYNYGVHSAIFESRPCFHGHFLGDIRPEYEQNLAVLYGISCELSDSTQLPGSIATFSLRKPQPPKAAPYTQEQVFAACLQTLLFHAGGLTKTSPLTVTIKGDGIPKPDWATKYEHPYFKPEKNQAEPENAEREHITVPGISIDESSVPGVTYLVIDEVRPDPKIQQQHPAFVPFLPEGESEASSTLLIPIWPGNSWNEPVGVITRPVVPYYERWHGFEKRFKEDDTKPHQAPPNPVIEPNQLVIDHDRPTFHIRIEGGEMTPEKLSAFVFSCIATVRPTEQRPLELALSNVTLSDEYRKKLKDDPAWKDGSSCQFTLDPKSMKLLKGSVPGYQMNYNPKRSTLEIKAE